METLRRWRRRRAMRKGRRLLEAGRSTEEVLFSLRSSGVSLIGSITAWARLSGVGLGEARDTVVESETWMDQREAFWAIQEDFHVVLREAADEYEVLPGGRFQATFHLTDEDEPGSNDE